VIAAAGQTILTTAGMLSGWITSIVSVSAPLIGPEARMVDWIRGLASYTSGSQARQELQFAGGPLRFVLD
jgi:hypothetical protein